MGAVVTLLIALFFSVLTTRIATVALTHTGLSRESARFQARSAFTGVGFTTSEAEKVVNHPVRRRILLILMLVGNVGIISVLSSLILTFFGFREGDGSLWRVITLLAGLSIMWFLSKSRPIDRWVSNLITRALKRYSRLDVQDYASLLQLAGEYRVTELTVKPDDWIADRTLADIKLRDEGVLVLGIIRANGAYIGTPGGHDRVRAGDTMIIYGRGGSIEDLDTRNRGAGGDDAHSRAVAEQGIVRQAEESSDPVCQQRDKACEDDDSSAA